ncbi:hypothetical protein [Kosakonia sacchari]|uniref:Uncharacterized protein n=1 Tax=Kosakonia sacchari TaxID=1158459 RepID=A0A1G4XDW0_9ENTR|nr:hypothetical protein [Kosakonia sacchari]AHJ74399.1 hypothetical protein C813_06285 [Kosakonia sacchari SP1]MDN2484620.1 hypothetical protein [Kosakonia sacchari]SCX39412.1 hypothetical protein SAMN02927897_00553 [Kosakonia sacchari]
MGYDARNFINSIVKNFKESIGIMNVLLLEPDEPDALRLLYLKLDVIRAGIEQDVRMLTKARLDSNAALCLYQVHNALNALNYCIGIVRNIPLNQQFYYDLEDLKRIVNTLDATSGRVFTKRDGNEYT